MRQSEVLTFPIVLRRDSAQPLHRQIAEQISAAIESGALAGGSRIPSTRTLAEALKVSRGVTTEAYDILHAKGYVVLRRGSGAFTRNEDPPPTAPRLVDLTPGQVNGELFPIRAWRAAWRMATQRPPDAVPPLGLPELRRELNRYVWQHQGPIAPGHEVVVTSGASTGLQTVLQSLGNVDTAVAVSRPHHPAVTTTSSTPKLLGGTCLVGDFAELLGPALPLGYAVVPTGVALLLASAPHERPSHVTQLACLQLLRDGTLSRQIPRMAAHRAVKMRLVEEVLSGVDWETDTASTLVISLPAEVPAELFARYGLRVHTRGRVIVAGYDHLPDQLLHKGLTQLKRLLAEVA